ncbi:MAG: ester cyclase [Kofleriaceae bacterium]|nr:ester cyclase [Kofleriaceae bacterium]
MPSTTDNRIIARRYLSELWSRGLLETADELIAPQCELNDPLCGVRVGPDGIKAAVSELRSTFPDLAVSLDAFIVEAGDQIALRWFAHGTHLGSFFTLPATGNAFLVSGLLLLRFKEGKLRAITACWEPTVLLGQLGLLDPRYAATPPTPVVEVTPGSTPSLQVISAPSPERKLSRTFATAASESELDAGWT